jgi:hypothetical protein
MSKFLVVTSAALGVAGLIGLTQHVVAQNATADVVSELSANEGIFVDGKTFKVAKGKAKGDPTAKMKELGAREVGPGAIIFRYQDKLYIAEGAPAQDAQAMKNFQDNWAVSYMKAMKDFQDNWAVSYMKDPNSQKALKDFQDNWNVSYMKAMKDFQDNWNVSYMKNFQDNWNVSYMKQLKDFQDNWAVSYMK